MTTRPEFATDIDVLPGLVAVGLFGVIAAISLGATFTGAAGFETDAAITATMGYALIDIQSATSVSTEGFMAALYIIAFVLDAALTAAVMLARRADGGDR